MSAIYDYSEPFSAECRAFGRLQESGHEELAPRCYGYFLLNEENERAMMTKFNLTKWNFHGGGDTLDLSDDDEAEERLRFIGKSGRPPPLRCIVKSLGQTPAARDANSFTDRMARQLLRDIIKLHILGIMVIDVAIRQMIDGKIGDFSTAVTMPHFTTSPELNPNLTPEMIEALRKCTFVHCMNDYLDFDNTIRDWNIEFAEEKGPISTRAYPSGRGWHYPRYDLRRNAARDRLYTLVDPRKYGWTASPVDGSNHLSPSSKGKQSRRISKNVKRQADKGRALKSKIQRLTATPDVWNYDYGEKDEKWASNARREAIAMDLDCEWSYKDGYIYPKYG